MYVWSQFFTILNHTPKSDGHVRTTPRRTRIAGASSIDRADVELKQLQYETRRAAHGLDTARTSDVTRTSHTAWHMPHLRRPHADKLTFSTRCQELCSIDHGY